MDRKDVFLALQFQYYSILNNQVEAITAVQFDAFVLDRQRDLALKNKTPQVKFATQTDFVRGFEQAWTSARCTSMAAPMIFSVSSS
jgi:hypothetical protein